MKIDLIIEDAVKKMKNNSFDDAFLLLNQAKSLKTPQRNLDMFALDVLSA